MEEILEAQLLRLQDYGRICVVAIFRELRMNGDTRSINNRSLPFVFIVIAVVTEAVALDGENGPEVRQARIDVSVLLRRDNEHLFRR